MPKLYVRYGTMKSSKTLLLISVKTSYEKQGKSAFCIKPEIDTRFGKSYIKSRLIETPEWADLVIPKSIEPHIVFDLIKEKHPEPSIILVDEGQFLSRENVELLRMISEAYPVIVYCLRCDFRGNMFEGSKRLFELSDSIEEVKNICYHPNCNSKAIMNLRHDPSGPQIVLGDAEYSPACYRHWRNSMMSNQVGAELYKKDFTY